MRIFKVRNRNFLEYFKSDRLSEEFRFLDALELKPPFCLWAAHMATGIT
jgi:hypothetical protein